MARTTDASDAVAQHSHRGMRRRREQCRRNRRRSLTRAFAQQYFAAARVTAIETTRLAGGALGLSLRNKRQRRQIALTRSSRRLDTRADRRSQLSPTNTTHLQRTNTKTDQAARDVAHDAGTGSHRAMIALEHSRRKRETDTTLCGNKSNEDYLMLASAT